MRHLTRNVPRQLPEQRRERQREAKNITRAQLVSDAKRHCGTKINELKATGKWILERCKLHRIDRPVRHTTASTRADFFHIYVPLFWLILGKLRASSSGSIAIPYVLLMSFIWSTPPLLGIGPDWLFAPVRPPRTLSSKYSTGLFTKVCFGRGDRRCRPDPLPFTSLRRPFPRPPPPDTRGLCVEGGTGLLPPASGPSRSPKEPASFIGLRLISPRLSLVEERRRI